MRVPTGCAPLDDLLGGGLEPGAVTLVFGEAGTGKTNLCLQLSCRTIQAGRGKIIYVDSEGVSLERLAQIAGPDVDRIVKDILFFSPQSLEDQERMVKSLEKLAPPGLVIVDSFNLYYRLGLSQDGSEASSRALTNMLGDLLRLTRTHGVPVLVTGQVYTGEDGTFAFGGRIMEHIVKAIIRLERLAPGVRRAVLVKHRSLAEGRSAEFYITQGGLVGAPPSTAA